MRESSPAIRHVHDQFSGFDELGGKDEFRTEVMEHWFSKAGCVKMKKKDIAKVAFENVIQLGVNVGDLDRRVVGSLAGKPPQRQPKAKPPPMDRQAQAVLQLWSSEPTRLKSPR